MESQMQTLLHSLSPLPHPPSLKGLHGSKGEQQQQQQQQHRMQQAAAMSLIRSQNQPPPPAPLSAKEIWGEATRLGA